MCRPPRTVLLSSLLICTLGLIAGCTGRNGSSKVLRVESGEPAPVVRHMTVLPARPADSDVRIMSFNLRCPVVIDLHNHWQFRKALVVQTIRQFDPDVLSTQECVLEQANYLRQQLPDYTFVGAGRNDGKQSGEMCAVMFKRDKFDQLDAGHFWLSLDPSRPGSKSWGSAFTRMVTWVKLRAKSDARVFFVFNTHFDVFGSKARIESAKLLRSRMQQLAADAPAVVTGDFNDRPDSPTYRALLGGVTLSDTFRAAHLTHGDAEGTRHGFGGNRSGPRIDWILASPGFTTVAAGIDHTRDGGRYPSDHFPAVAVVRPVGLAQPTARVE